MESFRAGKKASGKCDFGCKQKRFRAVEQSRESFWKHRNLALAFEKRILKGF